jgi:hypothetical protein
VNKFDLQETGCRNGGKPLSNISSVLRSASGGSRVSKFFVADAI